jgi:hypothetical protein
MISQRIGNLDPTNHAVTRKNTVAEASRPMRELKAVLQQRKKSKVGRKLKNIHTSAANVNWKVPFLWQHIIAAGKCAEPQMLPMEIVKYLKLDSSSC